MTFAAAADMRRSPALKGRIESSAYSHGQSMQWVDRNLPELCATLDWVTAWATAKQAAIEVGDYTSDLGFRFDVVTDDMIDSAVAALVSQDATAQQSTDQQIADLTQQVADLKATVDQQAQTIATLEAAGTTAP